MVKPIFVPVATTFWSNNLVGNCPKCSFCFSLLKSFGLGWIHATNCTFYVIVSEVCWNFFKISLQVSAGVSAIYRAKTRVFWQNGLWFAFRVLALVWNVVSLGNFQHALVLFLRCSFLFVSRLRLQTMQISEDPLASYVLCYLAHFLKFQCVWK